MTFITQIKSIESSRRLLGTLRKSHKLQSLEGKEGALEESNKLKSNLYLLIAPFVSDWVDSLISPSGLLLVVPPLYLQSKWVAISSPPLACSPSFSFIGGVGKNKEGE